MLHDEEAYGLSVAGGQDHSPDVDRTIDNNGLLSNLLHLDSLYLPVATVDVPHASRLQLIQLRPH